MNSSTPDRTLWPVSIEETRKHCRVDGNDDDALLQRLIASASLMVEQQTARVFNPNTSAQTQYESFCAEMPLGFGPVTEITEIRYALNGVEQVLSESTYRLNTARPTPRVLISSIPAHDAGSVVIEYVCGEGSPMAKTAILFLVGHWYENREAVVVGSINTETNLSYRAIIDHLRNRGIAL